MTGRAVWITIGLAVGCLAILLWPGRCFFLLIAIEPRIEVGEANCTLIDARTVTKRQPIGTFHSVIYDVRTSFERDGSTDRIVLSRAMKDSSNGMPTEADHFRIDFRQPARMEGLPAQDFASASAPDVPLEKGGKESEPAQFRREPSRNPLRWIFPSRGRLAYHDAARVYDVAGYRWVPLGPTLTRG